MKAYWAKKRKEQAAKKRKVATRKKAKVPAAQHATPSMVVRVIATASESTQFAIREHKVSSWGGLIDLLLTGQQDSYGGLFTEALIRKG